MSTNARQIAYPYLPAGRIIHYVPESNPFMTLAKKIRNEQSTDQRMPTGSVLVLNGQIIGQAANLATFTSKTLISLHKKFCFRRLFKIKTGKMYWVCLGCAKYRNHSEARAIQDAKKKQRATEGADLYLYGHWWCCKPCWDKIIAAGIKSVYLLENSETIFRF